MSRPRFLADHDLNAIIIDGVHRREPAVEIVLARELGLAEAPDDDVLEVASREGLIVVSHDASTMIQAGKLRIARGQPMAGLFIIPQSSAVAPAIEAIIVYWAASEAEEWRDRIEYLP